MRFLILYLFLTTFLSVATESSAQIAIMPRCDQYGQVVKALPEASTTAVLNYQVNKAFEPVDEPSRSKMPYGIAIKATGLLDIKRRGAFGPCSNETCTAVRISNHYVLTANHCAESENNLLAEQMLFVPGYHRKTVAVHFKTFGVDTKPVIQSKTHDWAVLRIKDPPALSDWPIAKFSDWEPKPGDILHILHHPQGGWKMYGSYNCRVPHDVEPAVWSQLNGGFAHTCGTLPGSSGAPVFNSEWRLIGIHTASVAAQEINRGISISKMRNFPRFDSVVLSDLSESDLPGRIVSTVSRSSIVYITCKAKNKQDRVGTGVVIRDSGLILTAAHVVDEASSCQGKIGTAATSSSIALNLVRRDGSLDIALMQTASATGEPLVASPIGNSTTLAPGAELELYWFKDQAKSPTVEKVFAGNEIADQRFRVVGVSATGGMSGAPVLSPESGSLIGIGVESPIDPATGRSNSMRVAPINVIAKAFPELRDAREEKETLVFTGRPAEFSDLGYFALSALWRFPEKGAIFVCWENPETEDEEARGWVREAVNTTWEKYSLVRFLGWGKCDKDNLGIRIRIADEGPFVHALGRAIDGVPGGMVLNFRFSAWEPSCQATRKTCIHNIAVHEFGHALGFTHEQNRPDTPGECFFGSKQSSSGQDLTPYDLSSVMNYCNHLGSTEKPLSVFDIEAVQKIYGAS